MPTNTDAMRTKQEIKKEADNELRADRLTIELLLDIREYLAKIHQLMYSQSYEAIQFGH